jgi:hypothetical protein
MPGGLPWPGPGPGGPCCGGGGPPGPDGPLGGPGGPLGLGPFQGPC